MHNHIDNNILTNAESPLNGGVNTKNVKMIKEEEIVAVGTDGDSEGDEKEGMVRRPLEDKELVGEEAAERARNERLEREREVERRAGDEVLRVEDERWDWMISMFTYLSTFYSMHLPYLPTCYRISSSTHSFTNHDHLYLLIEVYF